MIKTTCRLCSSNDLHKFLDLGLQPPSDQFLNKKKTNNDIIFYPLSVNTCKNCGFKQLTHVVDPKILYQQDYPYESSLTKSGLDHFYEFALSVKNEFNLNSKDLKNFIRKRANEKLVELGYEPQFNYEKESADELEWFYHLTGGLTHTDFFALRPTDYSKAGEGENWEDIF